MSWVKCCPLNKINLPNMLREVAYEPRRLDDYLDEIDHINPKLLGLYEDADGDRPRERTR